MKLAKFVSAVGVSAIMVGTGAAAAPAFAAGKVDKVDKISTKSASKLNADQNYALALSKSLKFYEAQRSGPQDPQYNWRINWRGASTPNDGSDIGADLSGGWYDAGDHMKFGLPMSMSAMMLAWGYYEFPDGYANAGEKAHAEDNLRFVMDYLMKLYQGNPSDFANAKFVYQVGDSDKDHSTWVPPEQLESVPGMHRPTYTCDLANPCTQVTAGTAAALAAGAAAFQGSDPAYSAALAQRAELLYDFAKQMAGDSGYTAATDLYPAYGDYQQQLASAATWLNIATGKAKYLTDAKKYIEPSMYSQSQYTINWQSTSLATVLLLNRLTEGDGADWSPYDDIMKNNLEYWMDDSKMPATAGGLKKVSQWGNLRYVANEAWIALAYAKDIEARDPVNAQRYRDFAAGQINYMLGSNPQNYSYMIGYGNNYPQQPHHRAAHGVPDGWDDRGPSRHVLEGALVGGPFASDTDYSDDRWDWVYNEVTTDYNAGLTNALAALSAQR